MTDIFDTITQKLFQTKQPKITIEQISVPDYLMSGRTEQFQTKDGKVLFVHRQDLHKSDDHQSHRDVLLQASLVEYNPTANSFNVIVQDKIKIPHFLADNDEQYGPLKHVARITPNLIAGITIDLPTNFSSWPAYNTHSSLTTDPWLARRAFLTFYGVRDGENQKRVLDLSELLHTQPPKYPQGGADGMHSQGANNPLYDQSKPPIETQAGIAITAVDDFWYDQTEKRVSALTTRRTCHASFHIYQDITLDSTSDTGFNYNATCTSARITQLPQPASSIKWDTNSDTHFVSLTTPTGAINLLEADDYSVEFKTDKQQTFRTPGYNQITGHVGFPKVIQMSDDVILVQSDAMSQVPSNARSNDNAINYQPHWFKLRIE